MQRGNLKQLPIWARELLAAGRVGRLGLVDADDHPRVLPVTFVVHDGAIWSAIDRKPKARPDREPARVRWLRRDPRAALTVDRYEEDWRRLAWVQVLGDVSVRAAAGEAAAMRALAGKYSDYAADPPPGPLLRLEPRRALWWSAADHPQR